MVAGGISHARVFRVRARDTNLHGVMSYAQFLRDAGQPDEARNTLSESRKRNPDLSSAREKHSFDCQYCQITSRLAGRILSIWGDEQALGT